METKNICISIIIPVYNVEQYIVECLESVAAQTYQGDIECIIVDDCGNDKSIDIANKYINAYEGPIKFKIYHRKENGGLSAARNSGLQIATGDYIYFLDSDDMIIPECLKLMSEMIKKHPNVNFVQGGILNQDEEVIFDITNKNLPEYSNDKKWIMKQILSLSSLPVSSWNKLIKREFLIKNNITFIEGIIHEDVPFAFELGLKTNSICILNHNTYKYRQNRDGSITTNSREARQFESRLIIMDSCLRKARNFNNDIVANALVQKWLTYIYIHNVGMLNNYKDQIRTLDLKIYKFLPVKYKIVYVFYMFLPYAVKKQNMVKSIFSKYFYLVEKYNSFT